MKLTITHEGKEYKVYIREITYGDFQEILKKASKVVGGQVNIDQVALQDGLLEKAIERVEPQPNTDILTWVKSLPVAVAVEIVKAVYEMNPLQA